jgi:hypothetical protein
MIFGGADVDLFARLFAGCNDRVVDVTDVGDPALAVIPDAVAKYGSTPIAMGAMSNGIEVLVSRVLARATTGTLALLRIHGHGNLGRWMTVSVGAVVHMGAEGKPAVVQDYALVAKAGSHVAPDTFDDAARSLARLRPLFAPYGSFEHMGCSLGSRADTRAMMGRLANLLGVPVSAGVSLQYHVFRFDGKSVTAFPSGGNLASWSQRFATASF